MLFKTLFRIKSLVLLTTCMLILGEARSQFMFEATNYSLNLDVTSVFSNGISAKADITVVKHPTVNKITFDLLGFTIDSVLVNGLATTYTQSSPNLEVNLPINTPDTHEISIFYRGVPQKDDTWGGFYVIGSYAFNLGVGFSSTPHNFGRAWFPCFDNFTDRATYQFNIITQPIHTAVCNGLLTADSILQNGNRSWHWQLSQPIPTYLAGIAVGKYVLVKKEVQLQNGTIPIILAAEAKDTANMLSSFTNLNQALMCYEEKFGPYLFDKVGYVAVPFSSGAMEHATSIAYPSYAINGNTSYETLMAHELSHHWWGDLATCSTAEDMWLNEGWASYCESVFLECMYGSSAIVNDLKSKLNDVLLNAPKDDDGYRAVANMNQSFTYGTHVYKKGALMAHALRVRMGDSAFFAACKSYLSKNNFKAVSTANLRDEFQQFTTENLNDFFNQYILTKGHYDVVVGHSSIDTNNVLKLDLYELKRYKNSLNTTLTPQVKLHFTNGSSDVASAKITNGFGTVFYTLPTGKKLNHVTVDDEVKYALAHTSEDVTIKAKGGKTMANTLFSINTQNITDSVKFNVQHHWVSPTVGNLAEKGIRISAERYWSIRGELPTAFTAWAFFNYDGSNTAHLDEELFNYTNTEDSLVMLYRKDENSDWTVIPATSVTYQPGGNPEDRMGRFWVNKLASGDYAFGVRDQQVVGLKSNLIPTLEGEIWPNPAKDELEVKLNNQQIGNANMEVTDNEGKLVIQQQIHLTSSTHKLSVKNLKTGVYHLSILTPKGKFVRSFIKQ